MLCEKELQTQYFHQFYALDTHTNKMNYLLRLIDIVPVQRRRHGNYSSPSSSRRQCTVVFMLPNNEGSYVQVCKKMFCTTFCISGQVIETLVQYKKSGKSVMQEERGGVRKRKYTNQDRQTVREHVNSFPRDKSHYTRNKAGGNDVEYLSCDLSLAKLYQAFKEKEPDSHISWSYYRAVFKTDFPHLSFRKPRMDTCRTCDRLVILSRSQSNTGRKAAEELEQHLAEADRAYQWANRDFTSSTMPSSTACTITIDLQKVFPLPKLSHSSMYYSRQLSTYNFGIHIADISNAVMCIWHEGFAARGGNEMASCLLQAINEGFLETNKRSLTVYSDNCAGQLKNRMIVYLYVMLIASGNFDSIEHKFLLSGHSYSAADRDFGIIEKNARTARMNTVEDVKKVIATARKKKPFRVLDMRDKVMFDFAAASANLLRTSDIRISTAVWLRFDKQHPTEVQCKRTYDPQEPFITFSLLPRGMEESKFLKDIRILNAIDTFPLIKVSKLEDLIQMTDYLEEEDRKFFEEIFIEQIAMRD